MRFMHAILTEDDDARLDAAHRMIRIAIPYMSRRWSETKPTNRKQLVSILQENAHHVELEWIEAEQGKLMTLGERYT